MPSDAPFKVGDRVWCNRYKAVSLNHEESWQHGFWDRDCPDGTSYVVVDGQSRLFWTNTLKPYCKELLVEAKVRQRCGRPATIISYDNCDGERPILATITMADGTDRTMSYSKYGFFYKSQELPIDLVPIDT